MTTFYMDPDGGNDANAGTSFALRWKTLTGGPTAARIAGGDVIRVMASPDPELVGNAAWTYNSRTVTLAAAKTLTIHECDAIWTASANVTATISTANPGGFKVGTGSAQLAVAAGFTTGKIGHVATGTLDLSPYTRVSLQIQSSISQLAGVYELRLCSDAAGAVAVHTLPLPAITASNPSTWQSVVLDNGGAMNSAIASVALYAASDPGTPTIRIDNIVACLSSATTGALTHNTLLGKVHALNWVASTSYAVNTVRIPTEPNRNGFAYMVTATTGAGNSGGSEPTWPTDIGSTVVDGDLTWTRQDEEESWFAIAGLSGTTVLLEAWQSAVPASGEGYCGPTGTEAVVATYKRECFLTIPETAFASITDAYVIQDSGTNGSLITLSGGWDRTAMTTLNGQTWFSGQNGWGAIAQSSTGRSNWSFKNYNAVKYQVAISLASSSTARWEFHNCHWNHNTSTAISTDSSTGNLKLRGIQVNCNGTQGTDIYASNVDGFAIAANGNGGSGSPNVAIEVSGESRLNHVWTRGNAGIALYPNSSSDAVDIAVRNWFSTGHTQSISWAGNNDRVKINLFNCDIAGDTAIILDVSFSPYSPSSGIYCTRHNRVADAHYIKTWGGSIQSATDQRYTPSGISWKFLPTTGLTVADARDTTMPLRLSVAKIAVAAGVPIYVRVMARRDDSDIKGRLMLEGGTLIGVPDHVYSANIEPTLNTWEQSGALTFTATEAGVAEIFIEVWDGSAFTTTSAFWIDDITVGTS